MNTPTPAMPGQCSLTSSFSLKILIPALRSARRPRGLRAILSPQDAFAMLFACPCCACLVESPEQGNLRLPLSKSQGGTVVLRTRTI